MAASTRVPVRGKRKQPPAPSSSPAQPPATRQRRSLATVLARRRRRRRAPPLEALPAELLEAVLLLSRNVALPRASLVIGLKLSPLLTRLRFFVEAFADTWLDNRGLVFVPCLGDPLLQTALLQLPWVTIDFILRARQLWADHLPSAALDVRAIFDRDYAAATTTITSSSSPLIPLLTSTTRDVHPDVRLPSDLLVGPWNHEQLRRLFWLMRAGLPRHPDAWARHLPWELKLRCLQNALLDPVPPPVFVVYYLVHDTLFLSIPRPALAALLSRILALPKPALDPDRDTIIRHRIKPVLRHMAIFNPNTP